MQKLSRLAALLLASAIVSAPALANDKGGAFVTVNGQAVSQNVYKAFIAEQKAQGASESPELKQAIKEELVRREVMAQEAKKKGIDKKPEVQGQIELARQAVLIRALVNDYVKNHPVSDDKLKKEYDSIKAQMGNTEYKARHVVVEKEEDAKAIIAKLDKGEKLADLAKQSKDPGSKDNGGDLGWAPPGAYVKPFADALKALKKGEYTKTPVKTEHGYHVILQEDTRELAHPPFDQIKPQLLQRANQQMLESYVKDLVTKAKVN